MAIATAGPLYAQSATGNTSTVGGGTISWSVPAGCLSAADGTNVADSIFGSNISRDLRGFGYGFSIPPNAIILGIQLEFSVTQGGLSTMNSVGIVLEKNGVISSNKGGGTLGSAHGLSAGVNNSFGGSSDLWGLTWTPADINSSTFAGNISMTSDGSQGDVEVDYMRVTVTYRLETSQLLMVF